MSAHEKIGFPNSYREGKEELIFQDIKRKVPNLSKKTQRVLDIGPGCSGPAFMMIEWCRQRGHRASPSGPLPKEQHDLRNRGSSVIRGGNEIQPPLGGIWP